LHLLDLPFFKDKTEAVKMELIDCAFPLLRGIHVYDDPFLSFTDIDDAILVGSRPSGPGMDRGELLNINAPIFVEQGKALNNAKSSCKVVVVGNPCNSNCLVASKHCTSIPKENFTCLTMLDHTRSVGILCDLVGIKDCQSLKGLFVLGNHSNTQVPIAEFAVVETELGNVRKIKDLLEDGN